MTDNEKALLAYVFEYVLYGMRFGRAFGFNFVASAGITVLAILA